MEEKKAQRNITDSDYKKTLSKRFGETVQTLMDQKGLSQAELGRRSGMSRSVINTLIRGTRNPSLLTALTITRALNVSLEELTAVNPSDITDNNKIVKSNYKIDFLPQLAKLLNSAKYYSSDLKELTQQDKDTILRLVYAYLDVSKSGNYKGNETKFAFSQEKKQIKH